MKMAELMKLVDALVEAKIEKILPSMVKEEIENHISISKENSQDTSQSLSNLMKDEFSENDTIVEEEYIKPTFAKNKVFSKNLALNEILNKTANEMRRGDGKELIRKELEKQVMNSENVIQEQQTYEIDDSTLMFDSRNLNSIAAHSIRKNAPVHQTEDIQRKVLKKELELEVSAKGTPKFDVVGLMARDYRKVLKATDEKVRGKR